MPIAASGMQLPGRWAAARADRHGDDLVVALRARIQQKDFILARRGVESWIGSRPVGKPVSGIGVPAMTTVPVMGVGVADRHFCCASASLA